MATSFWWPVASSRRPEIIAISENKSGCASAVTAAKFCRQAIGVGSRTEIGFLIACMFFAAAKVLPLPNLWRAGIMDDLSFSRIAVSTGERQPQRCYISSKRGQTILRTIAIALIATAMSVGLAEAKGRAKPKALSPCQTEQQAKATCACGPAKTACAAGAYCHAFVSACTR